MSNYRKELELFAKNGNYKKKFTKKTQNHKEKFVFI